jgi:hypothetical protein
MPAPNNATIIPAVIGPVRRLAAFITVNSSGSEVAPPGGSTIDSEGSSRRTRLLSKSDIDAAGGIERQTGGRVQLRLRHRTVAARKTRCAVSGDGFDHPHRRDAPHAMVECIRD